MNEVAIKKIGDFCMECFETDISQTGIAEDSREVIDNIIRNIISENEAEKIEKKEMTIEEKEKIKEKNFQVAVMAIAVLIIISILLVPIIFS